MDCLTPDTRPYYRPEPKTLTRADRWTELFTRTIEGIDYVVRVGSQRKPGQVLAIGPTMISIEIAVLGQAGTEVVVDVERAAGGTERFTLPPVLAGHELRVRVKGGVGMKVSVEVGWRPW